jgi:hypothetical protein
MVALPTEIAQQPVWRDAAALALDARVSPCRYSMAALTKQIELALFMSTFSKRCSAGSTSIPRRCVSEARQHPPPFAELDAVEIS